MKGKTCFRMVRPRQVLSLGIIAATLMLAACSLDSLVSGAALPTDAIDPAAVKTQAAALGAYNDAILAMSSALGQAQPGLDNASASPTSQSVVIATALMTDEAVIHNSALSVLLGTVSPLPNTPDAAMDSRTAYDNFNLLTDNPYEALQIVRLRAREAIGALRAYAPTTSPALLAHLYALQGYAEVMLSEVYCSGIPLSDYNFNAQPTYGTPLTNVQVYQHAVAQFDTAISLATDSARILNFAKVGLARAKLDLGDVQGAAQAVAGVPIDFQYLVPYATTRPNAFVSGSLASLMFTTGNHEGGNGLPYASDPRSASATFAGQSDQTSEPVKYLVSTGGNAVSGFFSAGTAPIVLASGLEAQLILAEAGLSDGSSTAILNSLRQTCIGTAACAPTAGLTSANLPANLTVPSTDSGKVTQLFNERAYWLYFTGHRQGDLRRLIRQYQRQPDAVYPTGQWTQGTIPYGTATSLPVPVSEDYNPNFHGCLSNDA
jgi:hypothetical protein